MQDGLAAAEKPAPKRSRSVSMPRIPMGPILKLVGLAALCAAGYFVYLNLPNSTDVPTAYVRLIAIYEEYKQLPSAGPDRDQFVETVSAELTDIREPLGFATSRDKVSSLDLNFAAGALLSLINATEEKDIIEGKETFFSEMEACKEDYQSEGGDIAAMRDDSK